MKEFLLISHIITLVASRILPFIMTTIGDLLQPFPNKEDFNHGNLMNLLNLKARFDCLGGKQPTQIKFESLATNIRKRYKLSNSASNFFKKK